MARKKRNKGTPVRPIIALEQKLPEIPNRDAYSPPTQHLIKDSKGGYIVKNSRRPSKTLLVNQLRMEVDKWRLSGYKTPTGLSDVSLHLLEWWFNERHRFENGDDFKFYFTQREAIETIIYLYEVKKLRDSADLIFEYISI